MVSSREADACAEVILVPTLSDNYAYVIIDKKTKAAACVDPAEPEKVVAAAKERDVTLRACLCTHKHADHSGGNERIKQLVPDIEVFCSAYEDTPGRTRAVYDGESFRIGDLHVKVMHAPCHTSGHVLYYMESRTDMNANPIIFTGDTLFLAGCGRFFEGDATQMHRALMKSIAALPAETLVYCGHEYSVSNLRFAASIEPNNMALEAKLEWAQKQRAEGRPTIPSSIGEEKAYNPFMRCDRREIQKAVGAPEGDEVQTMHILRERKNMFRG
ncbi:hydroxyacylglutathione hydrolase cytoplasmic [Cyclospora cayetanensis]|uniref:hydroxyacylglutathione hydrolase n=1 Tax=Cyclospora cayetanensis TaxID=88456 RepID=A0A6P6RS00_9EIME|nr:hydroxyacylglutathione hydrolase cytoplasmic [Cyclospora cayetanensis]